MENIHIKETAGDKKKILPLWIGIIKYLWVLKRDLLKMVAINLFLALNLVIDPIVVSIAIDKFITQKNSGGLAGLGAVYFAVIIVVCCVVYYFCILGFRIEAAMSHKFRKDLFDKIQALSVEYFDKNPVGSIISRMGSDTNRICEVLAWGLLDLFWAGGYIAIMSVVMLIANVKLALIILVCIPLLGFVTWFLSRKVLVLQRAVRSANSEMTAKLSDGIFGARTSKVLRREKLNCEEFGAVTLKMKQKSIASSVLASAYTPAPMALSSIAMGLVLVVGGGMVSRGEITIGMVSLFFSYANMIFDPITQVIDIFSNLVRAHAAGERVMGLLATEPSVVDTAESVEKYGDIRNPRLENWEDIDGDIEFRNVSFYYKEGEYILRNFNLKVPRGTTVALVGRTGAGKTTIVNLACRFYEPQEGQILIDGVDYRERTQGWLHSHLGYVLQTPFLFSGTVRENIAYGKMDASDDEIVTAAKLVRAHDFIEKLADGYDTQVGEGGALLSGGQKQLISFARAVLRSPAIFVLDEATSSVDTETESLLQEALGVVLKNRTSFVVAHRLSTIRNADIILVIDDGGIAEQGNHAELMALRGYYYKLYTNQRYDEGSQKLLSRA